MLTSQNRLRGMPVVWQDRQVGYVERAVADAQARKLAGLVVRRGIGAARWAAGENVALLGENCVVLRSKPVRVPEQLYPEMGRAFLLSGECAGSVTDALICKRDLRIRALEICQSPIKHLMGQRGYAVQFQPGRSPEEGGVVAVQLLTWAQVKQHLKEGEDE